MLVPYSQLSYALYSWNLIRTLPPATTGFGETDIFTIDSELSYCAIATPLSNVSAANARRIDFVFIHFTNKHISHRFSPAFLNSRYARNIIAQVKAASIALVDISVWMGSVPFIIMSLTALTA